jgi:multidrug efflux pump subunit AcrB
VRYRILDDAAGARRTDGRGTGRGAGQFLTTAQQRPEIGRSRRRSPPRPQLPLEVDREKVKKLGVPVNELFTTLQTFLGGFQVNDFTRFGRNYKVTMQAESEFRQDVRDSDSCSCATRAARWCRWTR